MITNLESEGALALTGSNTVQIDSTADGYGWFVDPAVADSPAAGQMDLLTVVTHELGHILGLPDVAASALPNDLMDTELPTGVRRLPSAADIAALATGLLVPPQGTVPVTVIEFALPIASPASSPSTAAGFSPRHSIQQARASASNFSPSTRCSCKLRAPVSGANDEDALRDGESPESTSAQDGFFTLLG